MGHPSVFVIVLSWNSAGHIRFCLDSLASLQYPNFSLVVVDNGSNDATVEIIRTEYPSIHLIENGTNLGYAGGNNVGVAYALERGADFLWLFNDDAISSASTLATLVCAMQEDSRVALVSPLIYFRQEPQRVQFAGSYFDDSHFAIVGTAKSDQMANWVATLPERISVWGTALLIRADVFQKIGKLDEAYFAYYEDSDYCKRAIRAGYRATVALGAAILHDSYPSTLDRPPHFFYLMTRNEYRFWTSHLPPGKRLKFKVHYFAKVLMAIGKCREAMSDEHVKACIDGFWDALCNVYGPRDHTRQAPAAVRTLLLWRPYFFAMLLNGQFRQIGLALFVRLKRKIAH